MDFLVDRLRFLGLNEREVRVFTALSTFGRMKMTKIASRSGLPRTTVDAIVRRLVTQGLVVQEKVGNHHEYTVQLEKVADNLDWIENRLRPRTSEYIDSSDTLENNDEKIVKDSQDGALNIENSFKERSGDRVRILLTRTQDGLDDALGRLVGYVQNAARTNTKTEILVCAHVADAIQTIGVGDTVWQDPNLIRLDIVPSAYCRSDADVLIFPDRVLMRDIRNGALQSILDEKTVEVMKHLLHIACETGWSINLSAWLSEGAKKV